MLRGINQQQIFEEDGDYERSIEILKDCKDIGKFEVYAYCLMGNHVHLLIKEKEEEIGQIIKRIGARFVYWYNVKYQRVGHLFQDRFKSELINDQSYFNTVLVYIHRNPVKAKLCDEPKDYLYSSYNEYIEKSKIVDTEFVFGFWNRTQFINANSYDVSAKCLDVTETPVARVTDNQAKIIIKKVSKCENVTEFQTLEIKHRDKCLKKLKEKGLSIRQISRLTGVSKSIIERVVNR